MATQASTAVIADSSITTAKVADNAVTLAKLEDGIQGDVLYYGASGAPARLAAGTAGEVLQTNGAGANPTWEAGPIFTEQFESTGQTISAAGTLTLAHGLAAQPKLYFTYIKCTTAEYNYSIGDEVPVPMNGNSNNSYGVTVVPDGTNLNIRFGSNAAVFQVLNKTTGASANITLGSWEFYIRAWA
jgi:hypothetical protein